MVEEEPAAAGNEALRSQLAALEAQREQLAALLGDDPQGPMLQLQASWYCLSRSLRQGCVHRIIYSEYYHRSRTDWVMIYAAAAGCGRVSAVCLRFVSHFKYKVVCHAPGVPSIVRTTTVES